MADCDEAEDAIYFGADDIFNGIYINLTTQGSGTWTIQWEYYNGSWVNLATGHNLVDGTTGWTATTGWKYVTWDEPTDWAVTDESGSIQELYYVRARVSAYTSTTTAPIVGEGLCCTWGSGINGEEYLSAFKNYTENKAAPLGQKLGATLFGVQGMWYFGMDSGDANNLSFLDADGTERTPYPSMTIKITYPSAAVGTGASGLVTRDSGGVIEYWLTSTTTGNDQGDGDFVVQEALPVDIPDSGTITVLDDSTGYDQRYRFDSWASGTKTFTFPTKEGPSTTTSGTTGRLIKDTNTNLLSADIQVGDCIRNETDDSWGHIVEIVDADTMYTTPLRGGTNNYWTTGDQWSCHTLAVGYNGSDTAFAPWLDGISAGATFESTVLYDSDRTATVKGRKAGRKPYSATGVAVTSAGLNAQANMPVEPQYNL
jgi:hypothetical protein